MAAVLSAGPDAVLSHRSAAALWGLLPPSVDPNRSDKAEEVPLSIWAARALLSHRVG